MALRFSRGFELAAQILSEQTILDVACFIGWNKPQIDQLPYYFWVKASTGWERKGFRQYLSILFLKCAKMNFSCNSYSTAKVSNFSKAPRARSSNTHANTQYQQMQPEFQKNSVQEFELFWIPAVYFSVQLKACLKDSAQWQMLRFPKIIQVNRTWGLKESKLA